ncbi:MULTISPECIES: hypothetical protein [Pseudomonas]|jgi:hypothetical protein|uniref:hypothetical protein n=1 Tax=Pseudomonas TaxID=286 RepID=UPI0015E33198|nr:MULTISPECIES: hypothetical protein [Pseudomonas]MBA1300103.1 hypothetical protein [Pseudomonas carnis]MBJ2203096.1 hypothetical protein [Pseudomonas carnis]MBW9245423.1 hypothetical protein [Pseudomonas paracarnis]ULN82654.1 hypothetical protein HXW87_10870 [Pseudomonas sp. Y5-11]
MKKQENEIENKNVDLTDAEFENLSKASEPPKPKQLTNSQAIMGILRNFPIPLTLFLFVPLSLIASLKFDSMNIVLILTINLVILAMFGVYAAVAKHFKHLKHYYYSQLIAAAFMFVINYCFVPIDKIHAAFAATFFIAIAVPFLSLKLFLYATNKAEQSINKALENNKSRNNLIFFSFFALCLSIIASFIYFTS